jgi:hypothetical protein
MELLEGNPLKFILFLGNVFFALSFFLVFLYLVQVENYRSRTKKYKFVSEKESKAWRSSAIILSVAVGLYAFILADLSLGANTVFDHVVSSVVGLSIGLGLGYIFWMLLTYYYPFILEKRLKDIRFSTMLSPKTGQPMMLLNEDEEDAHLSKEMIEEEDTLSVDYDVWIDTGTGEKVIERYNTRFHPLVCESCNFRTLMAKKEIIVKEPGRNEKGVLRKHYECIQCGHIESKDVEIPSWEEEKKLEKYKKDLTEIPLHKRASSTVEMH